MYLHMVSLVESSSPVMHYLFGVLSMSSNAGDNKYKYS